MEHHTNLTSDSSLVVTPEVASSDNLLENDHQIETSEHSSTVMLTPGIVEELPVDNIEDTDNEVDDPIEDPLKTIDELVGPTLDQLDLEPLEFEEEETSLVARVPDPDPYIDLIDELKEEEELSEKKRMRLEDFMRQIITQINTTNEKIWPNLLLDFTKNFSEHNVPFNASKPSSLILDDSAIGGPEPDILNEIVDIALRSLQSDQVERRIFACQLLINVNGSLSDDIVKEQIIPMIGNLVQQDMVTSVRFTTCFVLSTYTNRVEFPYFVSVLYPYFQEIATALSTETNTGSRSALTFALLDSLTQLQHYFQRSRRDSTASDLDCFLTELYLPLVKQTFEALVEIVIHYRTLKPEADLYNCFLHWRDQIGSLETILQSLFNNFQLFVHFCSFTTEEPDLWILQFYFRLCRLVSIQPGPSDDLEILKRIDESCSISSTATTFIGRFQITGDRNESNDFVFSGTGSSQFGTFQASNLDIFGFRFKMVPCKATLVNLIPVLTVLFKSQPSTLDQLVSILVRVVNTESSSSSSSELMLRVVEVVAKLRVQLEQDSSRHYLALIVTLLHSHRLEVLEQVVKMLEPVPDQLNSGGPLTDQLLHATLRAEEHLCGKPRWRLHLLYIDLLYRLGCSLPQPLVHTLIVPRLIQRLTTTRPIPCRQAIAHAFLHLYLAHRLGPERDHFTWFEKHLAGSCRYQDRQTYLDLHSILLHLTTSSHLPPNSTHLHYLIDLTTLCPSISSEFSQPIDGPQTLIHLTAQHRILHYLIQLATEDRVTTIRTSATVVLHQYIEALNKIASSNGYFENFIVGAPEILFKRIHVEPDRIALEQLQILYSLVHSAPETELKKTVEEVPDPDVSALLEDLLNFVTDLVEYRESVTEEEMVAEEEIKSELQFEVEEARLSSSPRRGIIVLPLSEIMEKEDETTVVNEPDRPSNQERQPKKLRKLVKSGYSNYINGGPKMTGNQNSDKFRGPSKLTTSSTTTPIPPMMNGFHASLMIQPRPTRQSKPFMRNTTSTRPVSYPPRHPGPALLPTPPVSKVPVYHHQQMSGKSRSMMASAPFAQSTMCFGILYPSTPYPLPPPGAILPTPPPSSVYSSHHHPSYINHKYPRASGPLGIKTGVQPKWNNYHHGQNRPKATNSNPAGFAATSSKKNKPIVKPGLSLPSTATIVPSTANNNNNNANYTGNVVKKFKKKPLGPEAPKMETDLSSVQP